MQPFLHPGTPSELEASIACQPMADVLFAHAWENVDPADLAFARAQLETVRTYPGRLGWAASVLLDYAVHADERNDAISVLFSWAARPDPRPPGQRTDASGATVHQPTLPGFGPEPSRD
jgi:hypothetical protein